MSGTKSVRLKLDLHDALVEYAYITDQAIVGVVDEVLVHWWWVRGEGIRDAILKRQRQPGLVLVKGGPKPQECAHEKTV